MATAAKMSLKKWICAASNLKEKESCCLVFMSSTKCKIRHFHIVVKKWRQERCTKKHDTRAGLLLCQSFYLLFFCHSRWPCRLSLLKFPNTREVQMLKWRLERVEQSFLPKESLIWVLVNTGDKWTSVCLLKLHSGFST